ncbi:MAG: FAD-binding oxidoreductase [bacterium]
MIKSMLPKKTGTGDPARRITDPEEITSSYGAYLMDESRFGFGCAEEIVFPETEAQVCAVLQEMAQRRLPVTISGARTGITSAAVPYGGVIMSMERMDRVLDILRERDGGWSVWVEPGVRLSDFHEQVETKHLPAPEVKLTPFREDPRTYIYPPDPTEETALIGSTVATNASGARSLRYGSTRNFVQALRVALTNGEVLELERGKSPLSSDGRFRIIDTTGRETSFPPPGYATPDANSTCGYFSRPGMDLIDLFIGSEGTLGVITAVRLKLVQKPGEILGALSFFPEEDHAVSFAIEARQRLLPLCLEYFDSRSLDVLRREEVPFSVPSGAGAAIFWEAAYDEDNIEEVYEAWETLLLAHGASMDKTWSGLERADWERLKAFRHAVPELINRIIGQRKGKHREIHKVSTDMAVPDRHLRDMLEAYHRRLHASGLEYVVFGHIGDNHLHVNIIPRDASQVSRAGDLVMSLARTAVSLGGVVAAEHGIGKLKHELVRIQYGDKGLREMARVKKALDPPAILGRGNIVPEALLDSTP